MPQVSHRGFELQRQDTVSYMGQVMGKIPFKSIQEVAKALRRQVEENIEGARVCAEAWNYEESLRLKWEADGLKRSAEFLENVELPGAPIGSPSARSFPIKSSPSAKT